MVSSSSRSSLSSSTSVSAYFNSSTRSSDSPETTSRSSRSKRVTHPSDKRSRSSSRSSRCRDISVPRSRISSESHSNSDDPLDDVASLAASLQDSNETQIAEMGSYFIGLKTAEEAASSTTPTALRLYYQMPQDGSCPSRLPLFLVYQSSEGLHFHFPIVQYGGRWRVKYGESNKLSYPSLVSLMRHHLNYLFASPYIPGTFDSFEVWKAYTKI